MKQSTKTIDSPETQQDSVQGHDSIDPLAKYAINGIKPINSTELEHSLNTNSEVIRDNNGQFQSGNKLGGRKGGSKNRITSQFIADLTHEWEARGAQCLSELTAKELVGTAVAILPKDVLVSLDQEASVRWVINAQPGLSTDQWLREHNLIESQPVDSTGESD
jgi:hypothetical protein